jgi:hypothetical protein
VNVSTLKNIHVKCNSTANKTNTLQLLIYTVSEVNLIKINCLKGELIIDENYKTNLKDIINEIIVETIGKIIIPIQIYDKHFDIEFHVVYSDRRNSFRPK